MLREPVGRSRGRALELIGVGREVAAGVELQPFGLASTVERRESQVGGADDVRVANYHKQRGRRNSLNECAGLVLRVQLERSQCDLVAPLLKPPLVFVRRVLAGEEVPGVR